MNNDYDEMNYDNTNKPKKANKLIKLVPYILILGIIVAIALLAFPKFFFGDGKTPVPTPTPEPTATPEPTPEVSKFKIYDTTSNKRPYAISVNNTVVAVKVQEGLNKAYLVYELPTEYHTSRLMALFKDVDAVTVGTIRSCRHNFMDYAHESDAILICYGWSHYAEDELKAGGTDFMNGNEKKWASAFWRNNPEKLAWEHTAYTSLQKLIDYTTKNNYRLTSDDSQLLNYSQEEVDLSNIEGSKTANTVSIPYGGTTTKFTYDTKTKMYTRVVNGKTNKDHKTKEAFTAKNIIVVKIKYSMMPDKYYWKLNTTGTGSGYYITNGKYVPIKWQKDSRNAKSKYFYQDGTEIQVNDGRTYIEVQTTSYKTTIK